MDDGEKMNRVSIHVCSKDRPAELSLLIQSLRTSSFQDWDLVLLDDASQTPLDHYGFLMILINRIKLENHNVIMKRSEKSEGVCHARNMCVKEDYLKNKYICRLDDDVIVEQDYLQKLYNALEYQKCDLASGVTPNCGDPEVIRKIDNINIITGIINEHKLDKEGNLISAVDDCGYCYNQTLILPTHQFRSCAMYKAEIHDRFMYPENLSPVGFREEGYLSVSAILQGYTLVVDTSAIVYHIRSAIGGTRYPDYNNMVVQDDEYFKKWIKRKFQKHGDFFKRYSEKW